MKHTVLETIRQLPPLPQTAASIEKIYSDPHSTFDDMVKVLESDPLLTADILKAANSPLYGFSREIHSMAQVVALFGMGTIRGFALASIVNQNFEPDLTPYGISTQRFSELSTLQHVLATHWYRKSDPKLLDRLSPAAFLSDIGKVILSRCIVAEEKGAEFAQALKSAASPEEAEEQFCETNTPETTAAIFDHWRFEPDLIEIIRCSAAPQNASTHNRLAAQSLQVIRTAVQPTGITEETRAKAHELAVMLGLDAESFGTALAQLEQAN